MLDVRVGSSDVGGVMFDVTTPAMTRFGYGVPAVNSSASMDDTLSCAHRAYHEQRRGRQGDRARTTASIAVTVVTANSDVTALRLPW